MDHKSAETEAGNSLANMAHELRTPLTAILGFAELLLEDESITGTSREYLQIIVDEANKLTKTISEHLSDGGKRP